MFTHFFPSPTRSSTVETSSNAVASQPGKRPIQHVVALTLAILATSTSLGIAAYAGWLRGGLPVERAMIITLGCVAVLFVHLLPMGWRMLRVPVRICAVAMWCVSVAVVLYGQGTFFLVSHQHAGNQRASLIPVSIVPSGQGVPPGRMLTEVTRDVVKVSADLAIANARRCVDDCPTLTVRRTVLAAQLAALNAEASDVKRRQAEEDRRNDQADRIEALRATVRADPVASTVASWLGTTERSLELMFALACAVVLEGAAIIAWLMVSITSERPTVATAHARVKRDRVGRCEAVASGHEVAATVSETEAVAPGQPVTADVSTGSQADSEDHFLLGKIHEAVMNGQLRPTQESIRKFLRCRQPKAGRLNRLYLERFGHIQIESRMETISEVMHCSDHFPASLRRAPIQQDHGTRLSGVATTNAVDA